MAARINSVADARPEPRRNGLARLGCVFGLLCLSLTPVRAQMFVTQPVAAQSHSGQFIIHAVRARETPIGVLNSATNRAFLRLETTLLAISSERLKLALYSELEVNQPWRSKIHLVLRPAATTNDLVAISTEWFKDGWQYRVDFPEVLDRTRYVRAMTQVLLLEMANRGAAARSAEVPTWLVEGLSEQLLCSRELELILPPPRDKVNGLIVATAVFDDHKDPPLKHAHQELAMGSPLSFQQLSWPGEDQLSGDAGEQYRSSSQLFLNALYQLKDGRACLRKMLAALPNHLNWQIAFLRSFSPTFQRPLDVEKWWALQLANFTGRDLAQAWPPDESWAKLDSAIRFEVQVHSGTNDLPAAADVPLQAVIRDWQPVPQGQVLREKVAQLQGMRIRLAQDLVSLADDYRQVIETFLENREPSGMILPFRKAAARRHAVEEALKTLDALDARRAVLRPASTKLSTPSGTAATELAR